MRAAGTMPVLGFVGGTGPQGRGLALRFALAGHRVLIGSRDPDKAKDTAAALAERHGALDAHGVDNATVCRDAEIVFVTLPYDAQRPTLERVAELLAGKVVVNCVNAIERSEVGPVPRRVPAGSAAEECAALLPGARIVSAFHDVSARRLLHGSVPITVDVLICGDDEQAKQQVERLTTEIPGMCGVDCGPLRLSGVIEDMTSVLLSINRRYRISAGLRIDGIRQLTPDMTRNLSAYAPEGIE